MDDCGLHRQNKFVILYIEVPFLDETELNNLFMNINSLFIDKFKHLKSCSVYGSFKIDKKTSTLLKFNNENLYFEVKQLLLEFFKKNSQLKYGYTVVSEKWDRKTDIHENMYRDGNLKTVNLFLENYKVDEIKFLFDKYNDKFNTRLVNYVRKMTNPYVKISPMLIEKGIIQLVDLSRILHTKI